MQRLLKYKRSSIYYVVFERIDSKMSRINIVNCYECGMRLDIVVVFTLLLFVITGIRLFVALPWHQRYEPVWNNSKNICRRNNKFTVVRCCRHILNLLLCSTMSCPMRHFILVLGLHLLNISHTRITYV